MAQIHDEEGYACIYFLSQDSFYLINHAVIIIEKIEMFLIGQADSRNLRLSDSAQVSFAVALMHQDSAQLTSRTRHLTKDYFPFIR